MDLKTFLKWEQPVKAYGSSTVPAAYLTRRLTDKLVPENGRFILNNAWLKQHYPKAGDITKNQNIPVAISINREEKFFVVLFDPPKDVPHYAGRVLTKADLWFTLEMPINVTKQYLKWDLFHEEGNVKLWKFSYDPRSSENMSMQSQAKIAPSKRK
jgi:hypothetical protein